MLIKDKVLCNNEQLIDGAENKQNDLVNVDLGHVTINIENPEHSDDDF